MVEKSGFTGTGALVYGELGTDHETQLVCGHFAYDKEAQHLLIDALPPYIHIKNYGEEAGNWMESTLKVIGNEVGRENMGGDLIALKMSEIIFAQALRTYMENDGSDVPVLSGLADPAIARALSAVHKNPSFPWSLEKLAQIAGMSRTSFTNRFSRCMTIAPLAYIIRWRMELARQELVSSRTPIIQIAMQVGYNSEAAFSRAFKKFYHKAPATYRRGMEMSQ